MIHNELTFRRNLTREERIDKLIEINKEVAPIENKIEEVLEKLKHLYELRDVTVNPHWANYYIYKTAMKDTLWENWDDKDKFYIRKMNKELKEIIYFV